MSPIERVTTRYRVCDYWRCHERYRLVTDNREVPEGWVVAELNTGYGRPAVAYFHSGEHAELWRSGLLLRPAEPRDMDTGDNWPTMDSGVS